MLFFLLFHKEALFDGIELLVKINLRRDREPLLPVAFKPKTELHLLLSDSIVFGPDKRGVFTKAVLLPVAPLSSIHAPVRPCVLAVSVFFVG